MRAIVRTPDEIVDTEGIGTIGRKNAHMVHLSTQSKREIDKNALGKTMFLSDADAIR